MKKYLGILTIGLGLVYLGCKQRTQLSANQIPIKTLELSFAAKNKAVPIKAPDTLTEKEVEDQTATYYIVVADTGNSYFALKNEMENVHQLLTQPIDSMGRHYNIKKNLIALPDNDSDEIYAGDYFPRRYPSNFLSLEYMDFYKLGSKEKTIALVSGIYEKQASADSALNILKTVHATAFTFKASVYVGCMH